jgi:aerobic-type carbon monoxide dehydrogenase small subunit (CoxS/CutS family)
MPRVTELNVNGQRRAVNVDADRSLLFVLRDELDLTGTKYGCGEGECGACTVLIDGVATRSCITSAGEVVDKQIDTVESLADGDTLHPIQQAFLDHDALQCGYCTSGMVMSACGLLKEKSKPSREEIVSAMNGNVCRCGTYLRIREAIHKAAAMAPGQTPQTARASR